MTDAVLHVVSNSPDPVGPQAIAEYLSTVGLPQDDTVAVRGALGYLKRKGLLTTIGRNQWVSASDVTRDDPRHPDHGFPDQTDPEDDLGFADGVSDLPLRTARADVPDLGREEGIADERPPGEEVVAT